MEPTGPRYRTSLGQRSAGCHRWFPVRPAGCAAQSHWRRFGPHRTSGWMDAQRPTCSWKDSKARRKARRDARWNSQARQKERRMRHQPKRWTVRARPARSQLPKLPEPRQRSWAPLPRRWGQPLQRQAPMQQNRLTMPWRPAPQAGPWTRPQRAWVRRVPAAWSPRPRRHRPRPSSSSTTSPSSPASWPQRRRPSLPSRRPCRRRHRRTTHEWSATSQPRPSRQRSRRPRSARAGTSRRRPCW